MLLLLLCIAFCTKVATKQQCRATQFRPLEDALGASGDWVDWNTFVANYIGNAKFHDLPVMTMEVAKIPCPKGCCNLVVHLRPNTTDWVVFKDVFIDKGFDLVTSMLDNPKTIVDAGGYVGLTSTLLALTYPTAKIYMLEPDPSNFLVAKMNTHRFNNVISVNVGLWSKRVCISMVHKEGDWGNIFHETATDNGRCATGIKALGVSHLMKRFGIQSIDFLKMDIEGAECKVLDHESTDLSWLLNTKIISIETHDRLAHHFGLQSVTDIVTDVFSKHGFSKVSDTWAAGHETEIWHLKSSIVPSS